MSLRRNSLQRVFHSHVRSPLQLVVAICATLFAQSVAADPGESRPNIVFVMTDDQGYWDTGATGNPHIDTPNMNAIAEQGLQLNRYYVAPVCAPTRAGLMTGRHYLRTGLYNTRFGGDSLGLNEITVAQLLQNAGYRTGLFGKWHLGKYPGYQPQQRGFDEFFGHYHGHLERYQFPDQVFHNGQPVQARGYVSDLFTDASIDFIEHSINSHDGPFFCCLMYNAPHSPFLMDTSHLGQPRGDETIEKYLQRGLPIREARIYALIERVDQNLGRLLQTLDRLAIADDTLLVFTSDNGGVSQFWKGGMNGNKAGVFEGGVRAPCFVRWPDRIHAGTKSDALASHIDWMPTFCELAQAALPENLVIDGRSLVSLLTDPQRHVDPLAEDHDYVYHTWDRHQPNAERRWSISDSRWKLLCQSAAETAPSRSQWKLFDLKADPGETSNLAKQHPAEVDRLRNEFVRWFTDVTAGQTYAPIPIPVANEPVEIEPSWATWQGSSIEYVFDGYDWDTIQGWKTPGEKAVWKLDVQRSGTYQVDLNYGCRPVDAGGRLILRSGTHSIHHNVIATSTADQFEPHDAGKLLLQQGEVELVVEVDVCPGQELMRLNRVTLTPVE